MLATIPMDILLVLSSELNVKKANISLVKSILTNKMTLAGRRMDYRFFL